MNRLGLLLLTMLMLASRLPGQTTLFDNDGQVVACNDGTIAFSVARAYRDPGEFYSSSYRWQVQGWYNVDPGKCKEIGPMEHYRTGGAFRKDPVTLLAFAFYDSTGTWGSIKLQGGDDRWWYPSNQQFCVKDEGVDYVRDSPGADFPRACDGAQTGYQMIPASFEYTGPAGLPRLGYSATNELHVKLGPSDRAIPMGKQTSIPSGTPGSSQTSRNAAPKPADTGTSAAQGRADMLKWVREDVNAYIAASATGFEAYKKGDVVVSAGVRSWVSRESPLASKGCWVIQGDTATTFSCLLSTSTDLNALRSYYTQLMEDVTASLPGNWKPQAAQPFGPEFPASKGYRSSSGAHGEMWIAHAATGEYELHYQLVTAETAARPAEKRTAPPGPSQRPRVAPIMVGKVDVSHLAGLQRGDTADYVSSLFGPPTSKNAQDSSAFGGYPHTRSDGLSIRVNYNLDNVLSDMKIYTKGSRTVADPLLDLLGKSESDAVAVLGSPKKREYAETIDDTYLIWSFPVDGRPAEQRPLPQNYQTLTLHFTTGVGL